MLERNAILNVWRRVRSQTNDNTNRLRSDTFSNVLANTYGFVSGVNSKKNSALGFKFDASVFQIFLGDIDLGFIELGDYVICEGKAYIVTGVNEYDNHVELLSMKVPQIPEGIEIYA